MSDEYQTEHNKQIASIIAQQLGGINRLIAFIGAKQFVCGHEERGSFLQFGWNASTRNGADKIKIILNASDTYTVEFWKTPRTMKELKTATDDFNQFRVFLIDNIYHDQLMDLFEDHTGLYLTFNERAG